MESRLDPPCVRVNRKYVYLVSKSLKQSATPKPDALRTFVAVAECGTLASASERLGRTPSAISTTLKQLESQFGGALFDGDRKSQLTALGSFALQKARRALAEFDAAAQSIVQFAAGQSGSVRVAAVPSVAMRLLPDVVSRFQQAAPDVRLEVRDADSLAVSELVREGLVDIGLASLARSTPALQSEALLVEPFVLVCSEDHPLARSSEPLDLADVAAHPIIAHGLLTLIGRRELDALAADAAFTVYNIASILSFVEGGLGVTLLPTLAVPSNARVATRPLADTSLTRNVQLLTTGASSPAVETFAAIVKECASTL